MALNIIMVLNKILKLFFRKSSVYKRTMNSWEKNVRKALGNSHRKKARYTINNNNIIKVSLLESIQPGGGGG